MRALMLTMDFPPTRGGIQTMCREILARASRTEFTVVAPRDEGWLSVDGGIRARVRRVPSIAPGRRGFVPAIAWAARDEARRADVVLAMHTMAAPGALLPKRAPVVVATHGGEFRSPRIRRVARLVLPRATHVIANSRFTRSEAVRLGADPMHTTVLPVGAPDAQHVEPERVEALRARLGGGRIVLSVARLAEHKGQQTLIRALRDLPADVRAVLVGEGPERARLEEAARREGVADRVAFAGIVPDEDLPAYFAAADVFALLSVESRAGVEGGGIALLEACAYGTPIVAARSGGIPETISDDLNGLLVSPEDPANTARAIDKILDDGALARRLGGAARTLAAGERSWAAFVERLEQLMEAVEQR
ncbi:MAG: glycosyltransferase family 4 protein [Actinobacteria bacterium]|nr:glycosyltransferase family 4 protein [Actinomycetota bacterium]